MKRILLGLSVILAGCSGKETSQTFEPPAVPILAAGVEVRDLLLHFEAMGIVKASQTVDLRPQVSGILTGAYFTEGQSVNAGDLLYTIDDASYALKVQEMQACLSQNRLQLQNAEKKWERFKSLSSKDLIAPVEWDELETKVSSCQTAIKIDKARLAAAKLDLEHCRILAPISGRLGKTALHVGNLISSSTPLVTLSQTDPLFVDFAITERELRQIKDSAPAIEIYSVNGDACLASGRVTFLDHSIDPKTGLLAVRGILSTLRESVWPGQSVRVHLIFGKKLEARLIPLKAIKTNQNGPYVFFVKEDQTVEERAVKLGQEEKGFIVVEEGLDGVDRVVTEGHSRLFSGLKVEETQS